MARRLGAARLVVSWLAVATVALGACSSHGEFVCELDEECVLGGAHGICQQNGFCSFPDPSCLSGQRYGKYGPIGVGGRCVPTQGEIDDAGAIDAAPTPDAAAPADAGPDAAAVPDAAPDGGEEQVVTFGETPNATFKNVTTDTWIDSEKVDQNHGVDPQLRCDGDPLRLPLLRFDVAALPAGAVVQTVELHVTTTNGGALTSGSIQVFRLLQAWVEGTKNGANGTANWNQRSDTAAWTNAGAAAPGSRDATVLGEFVPNANNTEYVVSLPAALVQGWRNDSNSNSGVILVAKNAGDLSVLLVSREGAAAKRPVLKVVYQLP